MAILAMIGTRQLHVPRGARIDQPFPKGDDWFRCVA
jgi:hypothetical protein